MLKAMYIFTVMICIAAYSMPTAASVTGTVTDTSGNPVSGATVMFIDESNPDNRFSDDTDDQGKYLVDITGTESLPPAFSLGQNYPNPFNPTTTIPFTLVSSSHVSLLIYNIMGQRVATIIDNYMNVGYYFVSWDGTDDRGNLVSAGIYLYQMRAGRHSETKKMLLLDSGAFHESKLVLHSGTQSDAKIAFEATYIVTITLNEVILYEQTGITITNGQTMDFMVSLSGGTHEIHGITFVSISGGTFEMGDEVGDLWDECRPVHEVTMSSFEMSENEVTNAQYAAYLNEALKSVDIEIKDGDVYGKTGEWSGQMYLDIEYSYNSLNQCWITYNGGTFTVTSGYENWPVVAVTWYGSKAFAQYYGLDLPREAEWEYACRGGKQYKFGTDDGTISTSKVNYYSYIGHPVEMGSYPPNPFGIYNMSGNVWEWCADWYDNYTNNSVTDPIGAQTGFYRVVRGGSWYTFSGYCRSAGRSSYYPYYMGSRVGFRVVRR
jgi:formylglycine-generating enzyme required for sulfatase activity